jgi:hypothetical protein
MASASLKSNPLQWFPTPAWATEELLKRTPEISLRDSILECCSGALNIAKVLAKNGSRTVCTNDIDGNRDADSYYDAAQSLSWLEIGGFDWVISNPPFNRAKEILPLALANCNIGIAMLLRLSYLEPCLNRIQWLQANPPKRVIVLPRISFTGDGRTDRVTACWVIWGNVEARPLEIVAPFRLSSQTHCSSIDLLRFPICE